MHARMWPETEWKKRKRSGTDRDAPHLAGRAGEATERTTLCRGYADAGTRAEVFAVRPLTLRHLPPEVRDHGLLPVWLLDASRPGLLQRQGCGAHAGRGQDPLGHPARPLSSRGNRTLRQRNYTPPMGTATSAAPRSNGGAAAIDEGRARDREHHDGDKGRHHHIEHQDGPLATPPPHTKTLDKLTAFLPNATARYHALVDGLAALPHRHVEQAREQIKTLVGEITLWPTPAGYLEAELTGNYAGFLKLAVGQYGQPYGPQNNGLYPPQ
jgi:hypothetical protein